MQAVALKKANDREAKHPQIPPHLENQITYNITKWYDHQWTQVSKKMIEVTHYMTSDRD